jgi:uncharacterized cupredoxin-like copper-binding protein
LRIALLAVLSAGLLGACSSGPGAGDRVIEISIEHSAFDPDQIEVEEGETVTFEIHNGDPIDHEFILGDEEIQRIHEEGTEKHHDTRPGEISVPAGATAITTYTFEEAGDLIYGCHIFGHYDYGMRGAVEVK